MVRSFRRPLLALSLAALGAACGSPSSESTVNLTGVPSVETLCKLLPNTSNVADVGTVLGAPSMSEALADGSSTSLYDYDAHTSPNPTIAILQFWFTPGQVFSSATVSNMDMPSCWHFDGGL